MFNPLALNPRRKIATGEPMRPYQERAAHRLFMGEPVRDGLGRLNMLAAWRNGIAVHIDMGLGKTIIGLTAIVDWFAFGIISKPVLVVAPIKVCETVWRQEAKEWTHTQHLTFSLIRGDEKKRAFRLAQRAHVYLINPEALKWLAKYLRNDWSMFDALLIDESSMFKDNRSQRFRVLTNYGTRVHARDSLGNSLLGPDGKPMPVPPHRFKRSGILTGTPSPSGLMNLWAPFYIIDHGERLHRRFETYKGRFFHVAYKVTEHVEKFELNPEEDLPRPQYVATSDAPQRIHEIIADVTIELNAEDYGVLPQTLGDASKTPRDRRGRIVYSPSHHHLLDLPADLRPAYDQLEKEAVLELQKDVILAQNGGAKSMMCWQLCNGAVYQTDEFGKKSWTEVHQVKLDYLVELVDTLNANCIIPYWFKHDLERIKARFDKEGIPMVALTGRNTERVVEAWNRGEIPNLLLHPQSAGHGLNLQFGGHHFIWMTQLWSLERYLQTNARLARSGQKGIVGIHHLIMRNTTDELMFANLGEQGDDMTRFRSSLRLYQQQRGMGLYAPSPFEGVGL